MSSVSLVRPQRPRPFASVFTLTLEAGAFAVAGVLAGIVAGLAARIAMRASALAAGPEAIGARTEAGNVVGSVTVEGTLALVIFGGVLPGLAGALLYWALRDWLAPAGPVRGIALGLSALALAGSLVIRSENFDFVTFGPAALNVAMFAALFLAFGVVLVPLADRVAARVDSDPAGGLGLVAFAGAVVLLVVFALAAVSTAVAALALEPGADRDEALPSALFLGTVVLGAAGRLWQRAAVAFDIAVATAIVAGAWLTATEVVAILS